MIHYTYIISNTISLAKIRQASTGKNNPMYGVKHSNESKLAIAKSKKGKKCYNNGKIAKMYYPGTEPNEFTLGKKIKELK